MQTLEYRVELPSPPVLWHTFRVVEIDPSMCCLVVSRPSLQRAAPQIQMLQRWRVPPLCWQPQATAHYLLLNLHRAFIELATNANSARRWQTMTPHPPPHKASQVVIMTGSAAWSIGPLELINSLSLKTRCWYWLKTKPYLHRRLKIGLVKIPSQIRSSLARAAFCHEYSLFCYDF